MVPVPLDHPLQFTQSFRSRSHGSRLSHYQHPQAITAIEKLRRDDIVGGSPAVGSHTLQSGHAVIVNTVGYCNPDARMVLMIAGPLNLDGLTV